MHVETLIIGAGPAGLTTGYELTKSGRSVAVVERDPVYVGGISRTVVYKGYRFDIGGHRFFSKSAEIEALWTELLGEELLERPRSSRIYYNAQALRVPAQGHGRAFQARPGRGAALRASPTLEARRHPTLPARNFEQWVVNSFGRRLFEIFFKTYTEKVWGMPCAEISADWAAQRIKGLNLYQAILSSLGSGGRPDGDKAAVIKTLINSFRYPRLGPGQMWESARDRLVEQGGTVLMGSTRRHARPAPGHRPVGRHRYRPGRRRTKDHRRPRGLVSGDDRTGGAAGRRRRSRRRRAPAPA